MALTPTLYLAASNGFLDSMSELGYITKEEANSPKMKKWNLKSAMKIFWLPIL
jgi:hypothetical protein